MKKTLTVATFLLAASMMSAQQYVSAIDQGSFSTASVASIAADGRAADHVSIFPIRLSSSPIYGGDFASYIVQWQPTIYDAPSCSTTINRTDSLPLQQCGAPPGCVMRLSSYKVDNYATFVDAKGAYDALPDLSKATAFLISTPATNAPYVVMSQSIAAYCP